MIKKKDESKVLDVNAAMQGSLIFSDPVNLRISGKFKGDLKTKGVLFIGEHADVSADIQGEVINVSGKVKGTIFAEAKVSLLSTAVVYGDITTPVLEIKEGAVFEGKSKMVGDTMGVRDLSRYLDIEEDKIIEWASSGRIPGTKDGEGWIFERRRIESWVKDTK